VRLTVVDPRILICAFAYPRSAAAKLLALFAYGRVCLIAEGYVRDEIEEMIQVAYQEDGNVDVSFARKCAERDTSEARWRKDQMEAAFGQVVPSDYLLAISPPLLDDLATEAQRYQGLGALHCRPDLVRRHVPRHSMRTLPELGPAPNYLGPNRVSRYDYLIHTAVVAEAPDLISDDPILQLPGDARFRDPQTRREVRPYPLGDFIAELPSIVDFRGIDPEPVLRAAVDRVP
jgi:hypothetical protein